MKAWIGLGLGLFALGGCIADATDLEELESGIEQGVPGDAETRFNIEHHHGEYVAEGEVPWGGAAILQISWDGWAKVFWPDGEWPGPPDEAVGDAIGAARLQRHCIFDTKGSGWFETNSCRNDGTDAFEVAIFREGETSYYAFELAPVTDSTGTYLEETIREGTRGSQTVVAMRPVLNADGTRKY